MVIASNIRFKSNVLDFKESRLDMEVNVHTSSSHGRSPVTSNEVKDPMRDSLLSSDCEVEVETQVGDTSLLPSDDGGGEGNATPVINGSSHPMLSARREDRRGGVLPQSSGVSCQLPSTRGDDSGGSSSRCPDGGTKHRNAEFDGTSEFRSEPSKPPPFGTDFTSQADTHSIQTDRQSRVLDSDSLPAVRDFDMLKTSDGRTFDFNSETSHNLKQNRTFERQSLCDGELLNHGSEPYLNTEEQLLRLVTEDNGVDLRLVDGTQRTSNGQALPISQDSRVFDEKLLEANDRFISNQQSLTVDEVLRESEGQSVKFFSEPSTPNQLLPRNESLNTSGAQSLPVDVQIWEAVGQCADIYRPEVYDESPFPSLSPERRENGQAELEFDDWPGQFEFYSPALQDCQFVLPELINAADLTGEGNRSVYRDLINTVKQLQSRVEVLGDNQSDSQERIVRVKQENSVLQQRVVVLEEQLRDAEQRAEERLAEEQRRNRELIQRIEREKTLTVENCAMKQEHLEETNQRLEEEVQRLRAKTDRHQRERNELENRLSEAQILAASLKDENKVLASQSKKELQEDQQQSAKVIEELRSEVERLTAVLESTGRKRVPSTDSITASTDQLTAALTALRQENKSLEEQVEELQAQLLTRGLEEGRELITAAANQSLAAEFDAMTQEEVELKERETVEELQKSLHDVQEANKQLRTYIDGILLTIVENHPQLLEVKRKSS